MKKILITSVLIPILALLVLNSCEKNEPLDKITPDSFIKNKTPQKNPPKESCDCKLKINSITGDFDEWSLIGYTRNIQGGFTHDIFSEGYVEGCFDCPNDYVIGEWIPFNHPSNDISQFNFSSIFYNGDDFLTVQLNILAGAEPCEYYSPASASITIHCDSSNPKHPKESKTLVLTSNDGDPQAVCDQDGNNGIGYLKLKDNCGIKFWGIYSLD